MEIDLQDLLAAYGVLIFQAENLARSKNSQTFLIRIRGGITKVLRIYIKRGKTQVQQEIDFIRYLGERGLPVPKITPNCRHLYVSTHETSRGPQQCSVLMDFEQGSHPRQYTSGLIRQMARQQAAIHIHGSNFAKTQPRRRRFRTKTDLLLSFAPSGFTHCDYDATNILTRNGRVTCILDFEGMRFAPLVSCLYFTVSRIYDAHSAQTYTNTSMLTRLSGRYVGANGLSCALPWSCIAAG